MNNENQGEGLSPLTPENKLIIALLVGFVLIGIIGINFVINQ